MAKWGDRSTRVRGSLHPKLQQVVDAALEYYDMSLISGHRSQAEQDRLYRTGKSKAKAGESKHDKYPSQAFDMIPHPFNGWDDDVGFALRAGVLIAEARKLGVKLRWGGDWDSDGTGVMRDPDEGFNDMGHFEMEG